MKGKLIMLKNKILIVGSMGYAAPFEKLGEVVNSPVDRHLIEDQVKLVVFIGGEDVHPSLYGGNCSCKFSYTDYDRDRREQTIFKYCRKHNIKMTGICRGFQFLNVMCGGFMYQHISNHGIGGTHEAKFLKDGEVLGVTSTHHQLVGPSDKAIPIAWSYPSRSDVYIGPQGNLLTDDEKPTMEVEAAIFPQHNTMGVQYHPEMMRSESHCRIHYEKMISDFLDMRMEKFVEIYGRSDYENDRSKVRSAG